MIEMHDLKKTYRTADVETVALNNINLEIGEGEFIAVMGPSGCGKSTLLNILGMLDTPNSRTLCIPRRRHSRVFGKPPRGHSQGKTSASSSRASIWSMN